MGKLLNLSQASDYHEILRMAWATKHPYLFTLIETFNPAIYVVIIIAGVKVLSVVRNGARRR
jgi:ascorbate-specific PTS system EIIC-type component UlaA